MRAHLLTFATFVLLGIVACDDSSSAVKEPAPTPTGTGTVDSGPPIGNDGGNNTTDGGDAGPSDCVMNPKTHAEIINACTNATKITKNPVLPKLLPDGGLPPLQ